MLVEVNVFVCWKCIEDTRFCIEVMHLYVKLNVGIVFDRWYFYYLYVLFFRVSCVERVLSCCTLCRRWNGEVMYIILVVDVGIMIIFIIVCMCTL